MSSIPTHIYVLELENNKYYVGKTTDIESRYQAHLAGNGSSWTEKYKPIRIIESYVSTSNFDEDNTTKKRMLEHGIENVRGGSYSKMVLEDWQIKSLESEFKGILDCCYLCGKPGHFAVDCGKTNKYNGWTELRLESKREELEELLQRIETLTYRIINRSFDFSNFVNNLGPYGRRSINTNIIEDVRIPLSIDFEEQIKKTIQEHTKFPSSFNDNELGVAKRNICTATNSMLDLTSRIIQDAATTIGLKNIHEPARKNIIIREILLHNKKQTKLIEEMLTFEGIAYKSVEEIRPVLLKEIECILDALLKLYDK